MALSLILNKSGWSAKLFLDDTKLIFFRISCFFCRSIVFLASRFSSRRRFSTCSASSCSSCSSASSSAALSSPCFLAAFAASSSNKPEIASSISFAALPELFAFEPDAFSAASCSAFLAARSAFSRSRTIFARHFISVVKSFLPNTFKSAHNSRMSSVVVGCLSTLSQPSASKIILWCVTKTSAGLVASKKSLTETSRLRSPGS
mmetsp:Transcript_118002/g.341121  ORF Transcript_118002/g.341121 Transcript_118002/m.341121 type:complete len:204 (-) Transcript_118002:817-1428(-)